MLDEGVQNVIDTRVCAGHQRVDVDAVGCGGMANARELGGQLPLQSSQVQVAGTISLASVSLGFVHAQLASGL